MSAPDKAAFQTASTPWRLLALLIAMTAIGPLALNILVPALPRLAPVLNTEMHTAQLTLSLFLFSLAIAQLVLGPLSDRFGRRPAVLGGLIIAALSSAAGMFATSIETLIVARIFQALGASTGIVIGRAIIRDLFDRERAASVIGLVTTAMVVAPMMAPLIGGLLDTLIGWQAIFAFLSLFSLGVLTWATLVLPETRPARIADKPGRLWDEWRALLKSGPFHGYVLAAALGSAPFFTFVGGGPHVVVTLMGRTSAEYGVWFMFTSLGYMSGNFLVSRLSQRLGIYRLIVAGGLSSTIGGVLCIFAVTVWPDGGPATIFLPQIFLSFGNGILLPNAIAGAVSVRPQAAGAASGITGFVQMTIGAIAAQLITVVMAGSATALSLAVMMLVWSVAMLVSFVALVRK